MIARSALVIHNLKEHMNYQFMNALFAKARRSLGGKLKTDAESIFYALSVSVLCWNFRRICDINELLISIYGS
jgi:hypothetical protein